MNVPDRLDEIAKRLHLCADGLSSTKAYHDLRDISEDLMRLARWLRKAGIEHIPKDRVK